MMMRGPSSLHVRGTKHGRAGQGKERSTERPRAFAAGGRILIRYEVAL